MTNIGVSLLAILPELVLTGAILVVVLADLLPEGTAEAAGGGGGPVLPGPRRLRRGDRRGAGDGPSAFSGMIATDGFALFFKGLVYFAAFFGVILGLMSSEVQREQYGEYAILLLCLALGMGLLAAARNLLMLYLALEMVSLPSYILDRLPPGRPPLQRGGAEVRHLRGGLLGAHALRLLAALRALRDARPHRHRDGDHEAAGRRSRPRSTWRWPWRCSSPWPGSATRSRRCRFTCGARTSTRARRRRSRRFSRWARRRPGWRRCCGSSSRRSALRWRERSADSPGRCCWGSSPWPR